MQKSTVVTGPKPEASPTILFGRMVAAQKRGDFIRAGEAQLRLEHLGWTIRRKSPNAQAPIATTDEVASRPLAEGHDDTCEHALDGGVLGLVDVAWLVGVTAEEVEKSLEAGRFPGPDGYVTGKPCWEAASIDRWANRGGSL